MSSNNFGYVGTAEVQKIGENEGVFNSEALELINTERLFQLLQLVDQLIIQTMSLGKLIAVHTCNSGTFQITSGTGVVT